MPSSVNTHSDAYLWKRLKRGDREAVGVIFDRYILLLYSYGHKFTSNREVVEDCIQELFAEIWEKRTRLSDTNAIKFYLFKGLRRRILRCIKQAQHWEINEGAEHHITFSQEDKIISQQLREEQIRQLNDALHSLTRRQKEALYLKFYNRFTYDEIAEMMTLNKRTVYNLISQAISNLQKELKPSQDILFPFCWPILLVLLLA
ncbi:RNA polymerase sigma factor (sigma-70 family) [Catalinimonas alkaloidigena]|uniref:RNA polymerase sigma factor n=1 Tax=Catalinimonas alkaloidigena TaxID=1075417 RepID=UPI002404D372|nr:sigma-70 family RNA polymerase sigma factor [Catalinimonas alkaloidigena]MDF9798982.1 RNA polymerase sigma factor (sigma-70 family) [Catalinimonas alkaloidigena]